MPDTLIVESPRPSTQEKPDSAVAWPAIIAGAFAAAALTLVLVALGSGLGLASVSPWKNMGASAATFTIMTAVWLIVTQWLSLGLGGYLTGRLRTRWTGLHTHEVLFRDTANGLITWAVASVLVAGVLTSVASYVVNETATIQEIKSTRAAAASPGSTDYYVDILFRTGGPGAVRLDDDARGQSQRILLNGEISAPDRLYLIHLISSRTGLSDMDAAKRVDDVVARQASADLKTRQVADAARKAGALLSIFTALSMLIGAFIASVAAALGGRMRDADFNSTTEHKYT